MGLIARDGLLSCGTHEPRPGMAIVRIKNHTYDLDIILCPRSFLHRTLLESLCQNHKSMA